MGKDEREKMRVFGLLTNSQWIQRPGEKMMSAVNRKVHIHDDQRKRKGV